MLEHMTKDGLLDGFYVDGMGLKEVSWFLGQTVKQVVHRHPQMKMLEIGKKSSLPKPCMETDIL